MEEKKCLICKDRLSFKISLGQRSLWQCQKCKLLSLLPHENLNSTSYKAEFNNDVYNQYYQPWRISQYQKELPEIKKIKAKGNILDIGCAQDWFIKEAKKYGFKGKGLDPQTTSKNIIKNSFEKWQTKEKFGVITLWSVLEHFTNPQIVLKKINHLLLPGGLLVIQTPNSAGLMNQMSLALYKFGLKTPLESLLQLPFKSKHWFVYNQNNLKKILDKNGFSIVKTKQINMINYKNLDHWFSTRGKKINFLLLKMLQLIFAIYDLFCQLSRSNDEMVVYAIKKGQ